MFFINFINWSVYEIIQMNLGKLGIEALLL